MSTKYWDLYVYYVKKCERENHINDIDPHHYKMEWNHFWPKCIFGDWPVGQWLTVKQHAIATALQTLAFNRSCLYSTHKSYLPPNLLELAWPYYCEARSNKMKETMTKKNENGKSVHALKGITAVNSEKDKNGKSINAVKGGIAAHVEKNENGKSVHAVKMGKKGGAKGAAVIHAEKDENGKSLHGTQVSLITNSQIWMSTVDGYRSTAAGVSIYNRTRGWPGEARVRLS